MSVEAMVWVLEEAPDFPPHLLGVLMGLANKADKHGRGAWPGQDLLAQWARKTPRAVRNDLTQAEDLGLIRRGDQSLVSHIVADERPVVWDLAVERKREREGKHTSAPSKDRKHTSARKPTSAPSASQETAGEETSTGTVVPPGTVLPAEGTGSVVQRDRKHTSANTSLIHPELSLPTEEKEPQSAGAREDGSGQLFETTTVEQKPKTRRKPETTIPADFAITPQMQAWANDRGYTVDLGRETFRFINHAHQNDRRCRDWLAAWRNWIDKAQERHEGNTQRAAPTRAAANGSGPHLPPQDYSKARI